MRPEKWLAVALFVITLGACQLDNRPRLVFEEDGFSIVELPGWTPKRERSSVVFVGSPAEGRERVTIAIRAVPLEQGRFDDRTPGRIVASTEAVLRALPGARVAGPIGVTHSELDAARFDLSFLPPERPGQRYDRAHVVLVNPSTRRIFHVMLTGPEGSLGPSEGLFAAVVDSLREEG